MYCKKEIYNKENKLSTKEIKEFILNNNITLRPKSNIKDKEYNIINTNIKNITVTNAKSNPLIKIELFNIPKTLETYPYMKDNVLLVNQWNVKELPIE